MPASRVQRPVTIVAGSLGRLNSFQGKSTGMTTLLGLLIVGIAVAAILRQVDVRLALISAGLAMGALAGEPDRIVRAFFVTLTNEKFVVPICTAMGFAYVLRLTRCDRHLVLLLLRPVRRVRGLLIPATVVIGFVVNIPVVSQTSTLVAIGPVIAPLLLAAGISRVTTGAALLLGCSIGGELLNPAAPELRTISTRVGVESLQCVQRMAPLLIPHLLVAASVFWILSIRHERQSDASMKGAEEAAEFAKSGDARFRVNLLKALVPLLPITLLFLTEPPFEVLRIPSEWLVARGSGTTDAGLFPSRLVGLAMLIGVIAAAATGGSAAWGSARAFFEGAGYAFTHIISVIVAATCFGEGVAAIGLAKLLGDAITSWPQALLPIAGTLPLAFAWVSGSGMASTQSLYGFFVAPAQALHVDPVHVGAVVSIGAASGRTMSPVAAVTLLCAALMETDPVPLIRRLVIPLAVGMTGVVAEAIWIAARGM